MASDMGFLLWEDDRCGIEVADDDGHAEPCGRTTVGWAWYDGGEHEPTLSQACVHHETDGAEAIARLVAALTRARALADEWLSEIDWSSGRHDYGDNHAYERCARDLRAALDGPSEESK